MASYGVSPTTACRAVLRRLVQVVGDEQLITFEVETTHDLDRVLHIFARTNMGGTKLSYVDLLVSTAAARMKSMDPKDEFTRLRARLAVQGFDISVDRILKTAFVLLGSTEPKFHTESLLSTAKLAKLEQEWARIATAMDVAVRLLRSFGLADATLSAENVIIPIASFAYHRKWQPDDVGSDRYEADCRRIHAFTARTLLRRGYWTGAVDPVLVATNSTIKKSATKSFPLAELETVLASKGKPITVDDSVLDELCELDYSDRRTKVLLTMLFPHMIKMSDLHKDHIFPKSKFTLSRLNSSKVPSGERQQAIYRANRLPNLQLLGSADNHHKLDRLPAQWWAGLGAAAKLRYTKQGVTHLPADLAGFGTFWEKRRNHLRSEIGNLLQA